MSIGRVDLAEGRIYTGELAGPQGLLRLVAGYSQSDLKAVDQDFGLHTREHLREVPRPQEVEPVHRLCDVKVRVRIEPLDEVVPPVPEVSLHLEISPELGQ